MMGTTEELLMSLLNGKHAAKIQHGRNQGETYLKKIKKKLLELVIYRS